MQLGTEDMGIDRHLGKGLNKGLELEQARSSTIWSEEEDEEDEDEEEKEEEEENNGKEFL